MADDQKPKTKRTRAPARPRLDAVIRHIKAGSYDEDMSQLQGAIADRQRIRQEAVAKLVEQTFGDGYVIAPKDQPKMMPSAPQAGGQPVDPEWAAAEEAARRREAELAAQADPLPEDPESADIESRSPMIGSVERGPTSGDAPNGSEPGTEERPNPFLKD